jgi:hypothetical protein
MIPISGLASPVALNLVDATRDRQLAMLRDRPEHARGIESFRERIAEVTTVDQLVEDRELYVFVMKAFDLEDQIFGKALIKRMLKSDASEPKALINRLTDPRFKEMYEALGLASGGTVPDTADKFWQEGIVDRYLETVFINEQAAQNEVVGAALEFRRKAAEIESPFDILKDQELSGVIRRALGLPEEIAKLDIDRQADLIRSRLDLEKLKDPAEIEKLVRKYAVLSDALDTSRVSQNAAVKLVTATAQGAYTTSLFDITAISDLPARPYR